MNRATRRKLLKEDAKAAKAEAQALNRPALENMSPKEIFQEFVFDAVSSYSTPITRFVPGMERIARAWKQKPDEVFKAFRDEVAQLRGDTRLPGTMADYNPNPE